MPPGGAIDVRAEPSAGPLSDESAPAAVTRIRHHLRSPPTVPTLCFMENHVEFEDRTVEPAERAMQRQMAGPAGAIAMTAFNIAQGNPAAAVHLLAAALAHATARTSASVEEITEMVKGHVEGARILLEEHFIASDRRADA